MARRPITTYAGGKGPRQLIWETIRAWKDREWTRVNLVMKAKLDEGTVASYVSALERAGIIVKTRQEKITNVASASWYRLVRNEGIEAPRLRKDGTRVTQGMAQENMWRTLRMLTGDTNQRELAAHASTPTIPVAEVAARDYLKMLFAAGYLNRTAEGHGIGNGGIQARYRLDPKRNTGPRPPMICRTKVVYDPNEDKIVWQPPVSEEEAIYGR